MIMELLPEVVRDASGAVQVDMTDGGRVAAAVDRGGDSGRKS
jgi:hypothetical protein